MAKLVTLTIDGKQVTVPEGTLIVDAAKKIGIDIPVFCYHPKMEPVGMCRMCLVDVGRPLRDRATGELILESDGTPKIQFGPKLETGCTTPVSEGMVVVNQSEKVSRGRKDIVEFILTSHPLDCPVCDKGGECPLQNLTMEHGPGQSRFIYDEKINLAKHVPLGELIFLDRERCIQCARCVRFQEEIADDPVIGFFNRGRSLEIVTFSEPGFDSYFSGNTTDICPVGALTTADFRFGARPWELRSAASVCSHCPVGCNITFNVRREAKAGGDWVIKRVMPRQNEAVNEIWICDKGRFAYHYTESPERIKQPLVRKNGQLTPTTWEEALQVVASRLREAGDGLLTLASGRLSNEDLFNLHQLTAGMGGNAALYSMMGGGDVVAQVGVGQGTDFAAMGPETAILVVASDLLEEAPIWWLRVKQAAERGAKLIVANPRPTKLDHYAAHVLRYPYGSEAAAVLALVNAISAKRPNLPESVQSLARAPELQSAARTFADAQDAVVLFGSEGTSLAASQALAQACANLLITTDHTGRCNNGLLGVWSRANEQGAWDMGFRPPVDLQAVMKTARALYIVAADPAGDDPELAETGDFMVVQDLFLTDTARLADVVLPVQAFTEREGSYTSGERRVQRFYPAVPEPVGSKADFAITSEIGQLLDLDMEGRVAGKVMARIAEQVPDYAEISYSELAKITEQWPIVGRGDMYYGGTTYENGQGLGLQLTTAAERGEPVALAWPQWPEIKIADGSLLSAPVTRLYDRGHTVLHSKLLHQRIGQPFVVLHPSNAKELGVFEGDTVQVTLNGSTNIVVAQLDKSLPMGVVLVPRSMGLPIAGPVGVQVRVVERVAA
ncbi:MAG TPA: NADH-quinone oxidoreductase subunit NuoG [Anaerolineales bacterium]|nr:NADH-quinone oxidoreductase subunit NuoG [Anaerolineales bacterium]